MEKIESFKKHYEEVFNDTHNKFSMCEDDKVELFNFTLKEALYDFNLILNKKQSGKDYYDYYNNLVNYKMAKRLEVGSEVWILYAFWRNYVETEGE